MEKQKNDVTSEELEGLFVLFARSVLIHMEQWIQAGELWVTPYLRCEFEGNGYHIKMENSKSFGTLLQEHLQDLLTMEKTQLCVGKHIQAGVLPVSTNENGEEIQRQVILDLMVPIVESCKQLDSWSPTDFTDEQILGQYHRCRATWKDVNSHFTITFPLINFSSNVSQPKQLSTHLFLAPLTSPDKTKLWNDDAELFSVSPPPMNATTFMQLMWKLDGTFSTSKDDTSDMSTTRQEALDELADIMSAMHLLKGGDVGASAIYQKRLAPVLWEGTRMCYPLNGQQVRQMPLLFVVYELHESDTSTLQELVKALQQLRSAQPRGKLSIYGDLSVALRRFNQSYERDTPEDQIIDLTIALESTLLGDLRDELKYRLAVRGAALLADAEAPWEPRKSKALLLAMYDARSGIVHNGQQLSDQKDLKKLLNIGIQPKDFPQQCEQIVRDVLKVYVRRRVKGQSVKQVNQELETRIVDGLLSQP